MSPLVSVITVTFNLIKNNRVDCFHRAATSVCQQTYPDIEHIIIDGASDDGTLDLFKPYEKTGKLTVFSEPDTGIYNAMNKGLERAKGKYIIFLNSDDYWHNPNGIAECVHLLELSQADFSVSPLTIKRADGKIIGSCIPSPASFLANMPIGHMTMLARTDLLKEAAGFDESFKIAADYDLVTRLILRGAHPVYTPCNFATFCEGGISTKKEFEQESRTERLLVIQKNFSPIIGSEKAEKLINGQTDIELIRTLSYLIHPSVAQQLPNIVASFNSGRYLNTSGWEIRQNLHTSTTKITSIFNIPLLKIISTPDRSHYKFMGCLPLATISICTDTVASYTRTFCICGIPVWSCKRSEQGYHIQLFKCITIFKKRIL